MSKEKKLLHSKFLTLVHVFSVIRYSIFKLAELIDARILVSSPAHLSAET